MTSLFTTTMFVLPAPPAFPQAPKPLTPVSTLGQGNSFTWHGEVDGAPESPVATSPVDTQWGWSFGAILSSSPIQGFWGRRSQVGDQGPPAGHISQPRGSIDSLRSSLDLPARLSPPCKPPAHLTDHNEPRDDVDTLTRDRNARSKGNFKPQKTQRGTSSWQLRQFAEATLGSGSLKKAVRLPEGEDLDEWLAVNVVDFYNQINLLYGSITEFCSPKECPEMKATDEFEYLWQDTESQNFKKPTKMSAPEYVEHLMAWCQSNFENEQMFPTKIGVAFPKTFPSLVRQIFKRLYRVYAHIYCHHYHIITHLGLEPHLNTSFKHYVLFVDEHQLATGKDFWGPLGDLVDSMLAPAE